MKVLLFFDQTQSGYGGKERPDVPLGVDKGGIGSYTMFERFVKDVDATVIGTMHCGNGYFFDNQEEVVRKIVGLTNKLKADVVICGPCFNYADYAHMSAIVAEAVEKDSEAKSIVVCSQENESTITEFKDKVTIVKMPKKGGTGLNESLKNMMEIAKAKTENINPSTYADKVY